MNTRLSKSLRLLILICAWYSAFALFQKTAGADESRSSILRNPGFKHLFTSLQSLVQSEAQVKMNHFFVMKYASAQTFTYMVWREGRMLWILELGSEKPEHWRQVVQFPRGGTRIDLDKNVVPSNKDVGSSTYLVNQAWVNSIVYDAVINGDLIVIEKKTESNESMLRK